MAASKLSMHILVDEILTRLPVKSLLRFKSVCQFFKTLISTPEFAHRHLCQSISSGAKRLVILIGDSGYLYTFHFDFPEIPVFRLRLPSDINRFSDGRIVVVGSTHGLACICTSFSTLVIFNPSTGIYRQIHYDYIYRPYSCTTYGFGFDDVNHDYKVVRVTLHDLYNDDDDYMYHVGVSREVKVYSLKSDSWSLIEKTACIQVSMEALENNALIDNHLVHWRFGNSSNDEHRIGCFDLRNNGWADDVPLPDFCSQRGPNTGARSANIQSQAYGNKQVHLQHLGVLDGCLCLLTMDFQRYEHDIWVMKEYRVKDSWVKLLRIPRIISLEWLKISPFVCGKGSRSQNLREEELRSKLAETVRCIATDGLPPYCQACVCNGSLVSIPDGEWCEIQAMDDEEE